MTALNLLAVQNAALLRALDTPPQGGWESARGLALHLGRDQSNLGKTLTKLEDAGLIASNPLRNGLTPEGAAQLAMINRAEAAQGDEPGSSGDWLTHGDISPDPDNARRDWDSAEAQADLAALAADINEQGLLQNLIVREDEAEPGHFILIGGERRWRAIGLLIETGDWTPDAPIRVTARTGTALEIRLAALSENLQRRDLNPIEKATAFEALSDLGQSNADIAARIGKTPEHVQQHRRLLRLDQANQDRMTLPRDDPRHLSLRDARDLLAKKRDAEEGAEAEGQGVVLSPLARLAWIELTHAAYHRTDHGNLWNPVAVAKIALTTPEGQELADIGAIEFSHLPNALSYCAYALGRYTAKRGSGANAIQLAQPFAGTRSEIMWVMRAAQAEVHGDAAPTWTDDEPATYTTPWLADPGPLAEEGEAVIAEAQERQRTRDKEEADRAAESAVRDARWQSARTRHLDLLNAATKAPTAGAPEALTQIASDIDHPLPWRVLPNATLVAANGTTIVQAPWQASDRAFALAQMIAVAANTAAGLTTPPIQSEEA